MSNIDPSVCCRECQSGGYNFECPDCGARYASDSIRRLWASNAVAAKNKLFALLLKEAGIVPAI